MEAEGRGMKGCGVVGVTVTAGGWLLNLTGTSVCAGRWWTGSQTVLGRGLGGRHFRRNRLTLLYPAGTYHSAGKVAPEKYPFFLL